ncbi:MAG: ATP-dependent zinc metalloprotease FtsH [Candidatus Andersenbacteria bacterium]
MAQIQLRPPTRSLVKNLLISVVLFLIVAAAFAMTQTSGSSAEEITLSKLVSEIQDEKVKKIEVRVDELRIERTDGVKQKAEKEQSSALSEQLTSLGVNKDKLAKVELDVNNNEGWTFFINTILPFLIPFLLIAGFIWFTLRSVQSGNRRALSFGQTRARETTPETTRKKIKFKDVAGMREAKEELKEIVSFLKHPAKFTDLGARIPKGALLVGAPGTGKTLLARAVAGEANVPFFHLSGSEFVEMFVGVGASRVRDLFRKAKKTAPSLVFIDEIDAVGRQRGAGLGGSHDEREQTLNQILVEMDGFDTDTNVIVVAATNRPDVLDPALLRPGRFDRRVVIDRPDIKDREAILAVHGRNKVFAGDVDLHETAQRTPGFTGADLENLLNEAAILAARRNLKKIRQVEILSSIEKVMLGPERKSHILSPKEKEITAYHEAGHALVATMLPHTDPVHKVSLISRGMAGGYTLKVPTEDRHMHGRAEFLEDISVMLAGYITEKEVFGEVTTGASNDLRNATELARRLVIDFGMSEALGPITYGDKDEMVFLGREIGEQRNYSEAIAAKIDGEIKRFIDQQYQVALGLVKKYRAKLDQIAKKLIEVETIERAAFIKLFDDIPETPKKHDPEAPTGEPQNEIGHSESVSDADESTEAEPTPAPLDRPRESQTPA